MFNAQPRSQSGPHLRRELCTLVRGQMVRYSEPAHPPMEESFSTISNAGAHHGHGLCPVGDPVHHCENVRETLTADRKRPYQVNMDVSELPPGQLNGLRCRVCVPEHLGTCTILAISNPLSNVRSILGHTKRAAINLCVALALA